MNYQECHVVGVIFFKMVQLGKYYKIEITRQNFIASILSEIKGFYICVFSNVEISFYLRTTPYSCFSSH